MNEKSSNKIIKEEKEIIREEKKIISELQKEENFIKKLSRNVWILTVFIALILIGGASVFAYLKVSQSRIYTDSADIEAPLINLAPQSSGILEGVYVKAGDFVNADTVVAQVGNELIKTKVAGSISSVNDNVGKIFNRGEMVVAMFDPTQLRVVGSIAEDKGLADIRIGQVASFTVDAFGSKEYEGIVDEISPTSRQGDIVFNISDKREVKEFNVKIRFDINKYPELKNGMSAKLWIYK
jgi:multidrug resistance efflux pump